MELYKVICQVLIALSALTTAFGGKSWPPAPSWKDKAKMARYLAHYADWGVVSAISPDFGYIPFGSLQSISDGPIGNGTGTHYFYMSPWSDTYHNVKYNNSVSLFISRAESDYCQNNSLDPEEPICSRVTLMGRIIPLKDIKEEKFAKYSLFSRHPAMKSWPTSHEWEFLKLNLTAICLLDYYGGATHLPLEEYFKAQI